MFFSFFIGRIVKNTLVFALFTFRIVKNTLVFSLFAFRIVKNTSVFSFYRSDRKKHIGLSTFYRSDRQKHIVFFTFDGLSAQKGAKTDGLLTIDVPRCAKTNDFCTFYSMVEHTSRSKRLLLCFFIAFPSTPPCKSEENRRFLLILRK